MMNAWKKAGTLALNAAVLAGISGCAGGGGTTATPTYTVGGTISGLTTAGLVLQNNAGDNLAPSANATSFTFATALTSGAAYNVSILTQPSGAYCTLTNGKGTASANVTNISVSCIQAYTIGGSVFGLNGSGLVLQDNGGMNVTVSSDSKTYAFVFPGTAPSAGTAYSITVLTNPSGQSCTVSNPTGTAKATVTNANVSCTTLSANAFTIGGTVTGLKGPGLILADQAGINNVDLLPVGADGPFTFVDPIPQGGTYNVSVLTQPSGRNCNVNGGTGSPTANIAGIKVICLGQWTWIGGDNVLGPNFEQTGVYGTIGVASAANKPGGREQSLSWTDAAGHLWMFGGYGMDSTGTGYGGQLNDVWKFDPALGTSGQWTWVRGSNVTPPSTSFGAAGQPGVYGTLGTPSPVNDPGGREQAASWLDSTGVLWMFGGEGIDKNGASGQLNDLWKYDPTVGTTGQWTWMGGSSSVPGLFAGQPGVYGTQGKPSASNIPGGRYGTNMWKDSAGNFWLFGGTGSDVTGAQGYLNDLWKYSPSTGQWTWVGGSSLITGSQGASGVYGTLGTPDALNIPGARDAGMSWTDSAGNFWLFGGIGIDAAGNFGYLNDLWKYTVSTGQWTWMGGSNTVPNPNTGAPGVYGTLGLAAATNVPGGRFSAVTWTDASGNFWMSGGDGYDSTDSSGYLDDLWKYTPGANGTAGQWTWMGGDTMVGRSGGQIGVYGTKGVGGTNNPGGRFGATGWTDKSGNLWMFGGEGYDSVGSQGNLNDLWIYKP